MLNFGAAGQSCCAHCLLIGVHERTQSLFPCFVTSGTQLLLRKTHASTLPDGFRSKDLDQVSTSGLLLPDERANLIGCTCLLALPFERFNRRQDARTRDDPFCNTFPQRNALRRTPPLPALTPHHHLRP